MDKEYINKIEEMHQCTKDIASTISGDINCFDFANEVKKVLGDNVTIMYDGNHVTVERYGCLFDKRGLIGYPIEVIENDLWKRKTKELGISIYSQSDTGSS